MRKHSTTGKILSLTKYGYAGPSSRYRFYNFKKCFENHGYVVTLNSFFNDRYFEKTSKLKRMLDIFWAYIQRIILLLGLAILPKRYDVILVEYELIPYFPPFFEYLLNRRGYKYIVDYDDPLFHRYDMHNNPLIRFFLKNKISKVIYYATNVIVCNDYLKDYAKKYNDNLIMLPTVVKHLDSYILASDNKKNICKDDFPVTIGWIGSKTTSKFVVDILPAIERMSKDNNVRFTLVGFDYTLLTDDEKERCNIDIVPWTEESEIMEIAKMDIGIMPLRDNPWTRGKCGFKLLQYMSCSKPVIASPVGVNNNIVGHENGLLANSIDDWYNAFEVLCNDGVLCQNMGNNGLNQVKNRYNYSSNCKIYLNLIESIIG